MSLKDQIHELFGVKEAHELPAAVMKIVMDSEELSKVITDYRKSFPDLKQDVLRDYFQECSADRKSFMQDYTPDGICQIAAGITGKQKTIADLCAGTGSMGAGEIREDIPGRMYASSDFCYKRTAGLSEPDWTGGFQVCSHSAERCAWFLPFLSS